MSVEKPRRVHYGREADGWNALFPDVSGVGCAGADHAGDFVAPVIGICNQMI